MGFTYVSGTRNAQCPSERGGALNVERRSGEHGRDARATGRPARSAGRTGGDRKERSTRNVQLSTIKCGRTPNPPTQMLRRASAEGGGRLVAPAVLAGIGERRKAQRGTFARVKNRLSSWTKRIRLSVGLSVSDEVFCCRNRTDLRPLTSDPTGRSGRGCRRR